MNDASNTPANEQVISPIPEGEETGVLDDLGTRFKPRFASNLLLWLILGFFAVFILWASLTELDKTVRGQGRVIPSSQMQVVSNLEGGIVEAILVNVGDEVDVGDPVVRLDPTQTGSELGSNRAQFDALGIKVARLQAEIEGRTPNFPTPRDRASADQIRIERALYQSRISDLRSLTEASRARVAQARRSVTEARATLQARTASRDAALQEAATMRPLVERGIEPSMSLTQAESRAAVAAGEVQATAAAITRAQASVAEAEAQLARSRQEWRSRAADELTRVQAQQASLRRSIPALEDRVRRTTVRAPLAGRVNRVLTSTVGGTIRPGDPVVEIVPSDDSLIVEVMIKPSDIGQVRLGQEAQVNVTAYQSIVYGSLDGEVVTISPDTTTIERTGETFYTVRVVTEGNLLDSEGEPVIIGPGMTADVSLLGDKQTIMSYILTPITRLGRSALRE